MSLAILASPMAAIGYALIYLLFGGGLGGAVVIYFIAKMLDDDRQVCPDGIRLLFNYSTVSRTRGSGGCRGRGGKLLGPDVVPPRPLHCICILIVCRPLAHERQATVDRPRFPPAIPSSNPLPQSTKHPSTRTQVYKIRNFHPSATFDFAPVFFRVPSPLENFAVSLHKSPPRATPIFGFQRRQN